MSHGAHQVVSKPWTQLTRKSERFNAYQVEAPLAQVTLRQQHPGQNLRANIRTSDLIKRRTTDIDHSVHAFLSVSTLFLLFF